MGVIVPKDRLEDVGEYIEQVVAPYDENKSVPEYDRKCWCVGRIAQREAAENLFKVAGTWDEARAEFQKNPMVIERNKLQDFLADKFSKYLEKFKKLNPGHPDAYDITEKYIEIAFPNEVARKQELEKLTDELWENAVYKPRNTIEQDFLEKHPLKDSPGKDCEECKGTGLAKCTYNPKSKWDWYRIGGRWDGFLTKNEKESCNGFNFGDDHESVVNNHITIAEHKKQLEEDWNKNRCFGIISIDGKWIEKGSMGWWGIVTDEEDPETFKKMYLDTLNEANDDDFIVSIDCHI